MSTREGVLFLYLCLSAALSAEAGEFSGNFGLESRVFFEKALHPNQRQFNASFSAEPEFIHAWDDDRQALTVQPFLRVDQNDSRRTHFDLRQLEWALTTEEWEFRLGVRKVFWGVTESVHLVDIINQTDSVEDTDGEDKLGQPMINIARVTDFGTFDFFLMPYFRERTFPGVSGRLRFELPIAHGDVQYESPLKERNIDLALRWFHSMGLLDVGVYHFYGTSREPRLVPGLSSSGAVALIPTYDLIHQSGLDAQLTIDDWLLKLELLSRFWEPRYHFALASGFEYTITGIFESSTDLGLISEYLFDNRGSEATTPFQNDIFLGGRLAFNDEDDTQILAGGIFDTKSSSKSLSIEASRRFGDHWQLSGVYRGFVSIASSDLLFSLRADSYLELELSYFY